MKKLTKAILVAILVFAAGCETFKEPQDDTVWFDLNVVGYPCVTLGGQQIFAYGESPRYCLEVAGIMWYNMTQLGQVIKGENMVADMPIPTMVRSIAEAKAHFSAIVDAASGGRAFVICRAGRPLVTITQYVRPKPVRRPGSLKGKISMSDDFDALPDGFEEAFG